MKRTWTIVVAIVVCVVVLLVILRFTGFEPTERIPGLWIRRGELVTTPVTDWGFTEKFDTIMVQTTSRYLLPESVTARCDTDSKGNLYISSIFFEGMPFPEGKTWAANAIRNPHVRLKIGNQLFDRDLSLVTDKAIIEELREAKLKKYHYKAGEGEVIHWFQVLPDGDAHATASQGN